MLPKKDGLTILKEVCEAGIDAPVILLTANTLTIELAAVKKKRSQLLDNNGFDIEIAGTE